MGRQRSETNEIDIPETAWVEKREFPNEASAQAVVMEVKLWLRNGNMPYTWRGHSHTRPARDAKVVYLDEFELCTAFRKAKRWSACPCCVPRHPRYGEGLIAWFPEEHVIRLIGKQCFKALSPDGHKEAYGKLQADLKRKKDLSYLISAIPQSGYILDVARRLVPIARDYDAFRDRFFLKMKEIDVDLWPYIRNGDLYIQNEITEHRRSKEGSIENFRGYERNIYAHIDGYEFFDPRQRYILNRIEQAIISLEQILKALPSIRSMNDSELRGLAGMFRRTIDAVAGAIKRMDADRVGLSVITTATIRNWLQHEGAPKLPFCIRRSGRLIEISKEGKDKIQLLLPMSFDQALPQMLEIGTSEEEAA